MKRLIICILLLTATMLADKAMSNTWCILNLKDGSRQTYLVSGRLTIIPSADTITIHSETLQAVYSTSQVLSFKFHEGDDIDAVEQTSITDIKVTYLSHDEVSISGIKATQLIRLFSTNGQEYSADTNSSYNTTTISLRSLPNGIYLITLPGTNIPAIKVIRK